MPSIKEVASLLVRCHGTGHWQTLRQGRGLRQAEGVPSGIDMKPAARATALMIPIMMISCLSVPAGSLLFSPALHYVGTKSAFHPSWQAHAIPEGKLGGSASLLDLVARLRGNQGGAAGGGGSRAHSSSGKREASRKARIQLSGFTGQGMFVLQRSEEKIEHSSLQEPPGYFVGLGPEPNHGLSDAEALLAGRSSILDSIHLNGEAKKLDASWSEEMELQKQTGKDIETLKSVLLEGLPKLQDSPVFVSPTNNARLHHTEQKKTSIEDDSTSVRFLGGWAETFPSIGDNSRVNSIAPVRIPFLLGTHRGQRPAMAILAPPESMTLYKRIPFLTGTRRLSTTSPDDTLMPGMGEDATTPEQQLAATEKARSKAAAAKLSFCVWRTTARWSAVARSGTIRERVAPPQDSVPQFDQGALCPGLLLSNGGRTVSKTDHVASPSFALWSKAYDTGKSFWQVRIDSQQGIMFIGCLEEPYSPGTGFARNLGTCAWMVGSYGYVCRTGPHGQESLTDQVKKELNDETVGLLSFGTGSVVKMCLDRDEGTLHIQVNDIPPFTLHGVSARARPFVNIAKEGDRMSIIPEGELDLVVRGDLGAVGEALSEIKGEQSLTDDEILRIREEADQYWK